MDTSRHDQNVQVVRDVHSYLKLTNLLFLHSLMLATFLMATYTKSPSSFRFIATKKTCASLYLKANETSEILYYSNRQTCSPANLEHSFLRILVQLANHCTSHYFSD